MSTVRKIYKNASYLGIAEVVSRALQFMVMLAAVRMLSQAEFGKFSFALSLSLIAMVLADAGIFTMLVREIARNKKLAAKYFVNAVWVKIILGIATFALIYVALNAMDYDPLTKQIVYIIWSFAILSTFTQVFFSIFRAFEMMKYDAVLKITRMVLLTIATITVLMQGKGILLFSWSFVVVEIITILLASVIAVKKFIKISWLVDLQFSKEMIKKALPFGMAFVFGSIYFYIGNIILSIMKGDIEVAIFSAAFNIALALLFIPNVYTNTIFPVLSRFYTKSKSKVAIVFEKSFKYTYLVALPIGAGLYIVAEDLIYFLYGPDYAYAAIVLKIISVYLVLKFINFVLGIMLSSIDRQKQRMYGQAATAFCNIILNLILIPIAGFLGAAIATVVTEIILLGIYYGLVTRYWGSFNFLPLIPKPLIATAIMAVIISMLPFHFMILSVIGAVIYGISLLALKTFDQDDIRFIRKALLHETK